MRDFPMRRLLIREVGGMVISQGVLLQQQGEFRRNPHHYG